MQDKIVQVDTLAAGHASPDAPSMPPHFEIQFACVAGYPGVEVSVARFSGPLAPPMIWSGFGLWVPIEGANEVWYARGTRFVDAGRPLVGTAGEVVRVQKRYGTQTRDLCVSVLPDDYRELLLERGRRSTSTIQTGCPTGGELASLTSTLVDACLGNRGLETAFHFERWIDRIADHAAESPAPPSSPSPGLLRAREYLHAHFDTNVTIADLASVSGLSRFYLVKAFGRSFGVPPHRYQDLLRLERARTLMHTELRLTDIALSVGYSDHSHFTRRFKRSFGCTPTEYRQLGRVTDRPEERARKSAVQPRARTRTPSP